MIKEYLKDPWCNAPKEIEQYLNGSCEIFAIAARRLFKWDIFVITEERLINGLGIATGLVHAFTIPSTNPNDIFDAKGIRDSNLLTNEYNLHDDVKISFMEENELITLVHNPGDQLYKTLTIEQIEVLISNAELFIKEHYSYIQT